jgi:hypothetical protein
MTTADTPAFPASPEVWAQIQLARAARQMGREIRRGKPVVLNQYGTRRREQR